MRIILSAIGGSGAVAAISAVGIAGRALSGAFSGIGNALGNLAFGFTNLSTAGTVGMDAMKLGVVQLGTSLLAVGAILGVLIAAIAVGVGIAAVKAFGDFQQTLQRLVTGGGDVTDNMQKMGQAILGVSVATGVLTSGTDGLNAAMYLIVSANQRGAQAITTLTAAAQGAQIEMANVVDVTQILTTLQTDFGLKTYTATQYMNGLIAAVANGKISLENLSTAMSPILPNAKELGVHFADVAAAMSDMTNQGIPADQAATALRFVMQAMILPTKASEKAMAEWGLNSTKVAAEMKVSLPGAIQMYIDAAKRAGPEGSKPFIDALSAMMGGGQRSAKALFSLSQSMDQWRKDIGLVNIGLGQNSNSVMGWDKAQKNWNITMERGRAALAAFMINLGSQVVPIFTKIIALLMPIVAGFLNWVSSSRIIVNILQGLYVALATLVTIGSAFSSFLQHNAVAMAAFKAVLIALAIIVGGVVVAALVAAAIAAWTFTYALLANPITWIAAAIIAAIVGIVLAIQHWGQIAHWIQGVWGAVTSWIGEQFNRLGSTLSKIGPLVAVFNAIKAALGDLKAAFLAALGPIVDTWKSSILPALLAVRDAFGSLVSMLSAIFLPAWNNIKAGFIQVLPYLQQFGGYLLGQLKPILLLVAGILGGTLAMAIGTFIGLLKGVIGFLSAFITGIVQIISGIVRIAAGTFQVIISIFGGLFNILRDIFTGNWGKIKQDAINMWNGIKSGILNIVGGLWSVLQGLWNAGVQSIMNFVSGFITGVIGFFQHLFNALVGHSIVPDLITGIINSFAKLIGGVMNAIASLPGRLASFFANIASQAVGWGLNILKQLANGILSGFSFIGNAMSNLGGFIRSHLPQSPAKIGPLRDLLKQGTMISDQIAQGIIAGSPKLQIALNASLKPLVLAPSSLAPSTTGGGSGSNSVTHNHNISITFSMLLPPTNSTQVRQVVDMIETELGKRMRTQTPGYGTGGVF